MISKLLLSVNYIILKWLLKPYVSHNTQCGRSLAGALTGTELKVQENQQAIMNFIITYREYISVPAGF